MPVGSEDREGNMGRKKDYSDIPSNGGKSNRAFRSEAETRLNGQDFDDVNKPSKSKRKKEYNPSNKGPIENRSCTDVLCCILFIVFIAGLVLVGYYAYTFGNPTVLLYPQNSEGDLCGYGQYKDKPYLFFFDLVQCARLGPGVVVNGCPTPQICVSNCPNESFVFLQAAVSDKAKMICKDGADKTKNVLDLVMDQDCAPYYLKSENIAGRCLPLGILIDAANKVVDGTGNLVTVAGVQGAINQSMLNDAAYVFELFFEAKQLGEKVINDVQTAWWMILVLLGFACVVSLIWIILMRWIAGIMIWVSVVAFVLLWAGGSGFSFYQYYQITQSNETSPIYTFHLAVVQLTFEKANLFLGLGITAGVIFLIVFLIFLFLITRIRIAIALIEEGSRAIGCMVYTLFWPVFPFILQIAVIGLWGVIAVFLASIGRNTHLPNMNVTFPNGTIDPNAVVQHSDSLIDNICSSEFLPTANNSLGDFCTTVRYNADEYTIYLQIFNLFMLFWLVNFVVAFGEMTLAGAFSSYYWAWDKKQDIPTFPLISAMWRTLRYHLGTLAFGSLIIAIIQIIRVFLEYIDSKLKGTENPVGKFFIKCMKCCFWCLEKFLKFLNKNAYILTAVYGKNFCSSARRAFVLIVENVVRVVVLDKVTDFLLFIAKLVVVGAVGVGSFFFFDGRIAFLKTYTPQLNFYVVPIILVVLGAYIIASCFFSVYEMAVDTLFMCFLMDLKHNDGSDEKPHYMSKKLKKILGKTNKPREDN